MIDDRPAAFCAVIHFPHATAKNIKRVTRLVVLPDYQGVGLSRHMLEFVAQLWIRRGYRMTITTSNPALCVMFGGDVHWQLKQLGRMKPPKGLKCLRRTSSARRMTTSWEYVG